MIDKSIAEYWRERYDLGYILRRDWKTLGPKLAGKIHLKVGTHDEFYLSAAVRQVEVFLESTKEPSYAGSEMSPVCRAGSMRPCGGGLLEHCV